MKVVISVDVNMANWHVPGYVTKTGKVNKVLVLGQKGCGKTSILEQLVYGHLNNIIYETIEDVYVANVESDRGTKEKIRFYDTGGLEAKSREIPRHLLHAVDGVVLVYSINDVDSFTTIDMVKKDIDRSKEKKEITIIVLGNKKDLDSCRTVDPSMVMQWALRERVKCFEVSSFDRKSLGEPFVYLASKMNPPTNKSSFPLGRKMRPTISLDS